MAKQKRMVDGLMEGLKDALAHSRGKLALKERAREIPGPAPHWTPSKIRNLRKNTLKLSQPYFAAMLNVTASTVRSWEQGQKTPSGAAARLLQLIEADERVLDTLVA